MPMMYLLLSRHLQLFRVAQTQILADDELSDAADSFVWINDAMEYRVQDLKGTPGRTCQ